MRAIRHIPFGSRDSASGIVRVIGLLLAATMTGCASPKSIPQEAPVARPETRQRAVECLRAGIKYEANPVVRTQAVEAIASTEYTDLLPWMRTALLDQHAAVRFAACVALGTMRDRVSESKIRELLHDPDVNVKLGALYAIHRMGDSSRTDELSTYLLQHEDPVVRRHAAMLLGLIGEPSAVKLLARAMRDADAGVRVNALAAMARLGTRDAKQELVFMTSSGVGADETLAVQSLAETRDRTYVETFQYKLGTAMHVETKLAAARGLGMLGSDEGFDEAIRSLRQPAAPRPDPNDLPLDQALRVKQLAAGALGEIGRTDALPVLSDMMEHDKDPRVQISAAQAVLKIVTRQRSDALSRAIPPPTTKR